MNVKNKQEQPYTTMKDTPNLIKVGFKKKKNYPSSICTC